ncbi:MAG: hypothetical protein A3J97_05560 [Spirochaetes bacterium RIFOXYC1_FULL_54_7]|nr:MAG: hypothetical protein A3J97_05560 [Spirochaetes bacterium RIFOXYC1_FULL_54_7]
MKELPTFRNEDEERQFWSEHDSTEFVDWTKSRQAVFPDLKLSTKTDSREHNPHRIKGGNSGRE